MNQAKLKILHITAMYPSKSYPALGSYVKSQVDSLKKYTDNEIFIIQGLKGSVPYIKAIPKILRKIYFSKFDIIHVHYGNLSSLVKLLYWGHTPIVTSYCGGDLLTHKNDHSLKNLFFRWLNLLLTRWDACSIVKSKVLSDQIKKSGRVEIVPNGVDIDQFNVIDKKVAREKIGLNNFKETVILFPGDPGLPVKNFSLLEAVLNGFDKERIKVLTFAGNKINHADIPYYFNAADIIAFTSVSEGSPNVIKEAMACNCKIYSTNCGDVEWLLKDVEGSKVLSYSKLEWNRSFLKFFKQPGLVSSNSRDALLHKKLDTESIAKKVVSIYYSLINYRK